MAKEYLKCRMEQYAAALPLPDNPVLANVGLTDSNLMAPDEMKNLGFAEENQPLDEQNRAKEQGTGNVAATRGQIS